MISLACVGPNMRQTTGLEWRAQHTTAYITRQLT